MKPLLEEVRDSYYDGLFAEILTVSPEGIPSIADKDSAESCAIASELLRRVRTPKIAKRLAGQVAGKKFESVTHSFLKRALPLFKSANPGEWKVEHVHSRNGVAQLSRFAQYRHLLDLERLASTDHALRVAIGTEYVIAPDIVVYREPVSDQFLNGTQFVVGADIARRTPLRRTNNALPLLHASISCKWTIRSDRSQNARSEGVGLLRNRKGRAPHIAVVTAEPLPSRISSLALGLGDIDCVYHIALDELSDAANSVGTRESQSLLSTMIDGARLRDIADLAVDLAS